MFWNLGYTFPEAQSFILKYKPAAVHGPQERYQRCAWWLDPGQQTHCGVSVHTLLSVQECGWSYRLGDEKTGAHVLCDSVLFKKITTEPDLYCLGFCGKTEERGSCCFVERVLRTEGIIHSAVMLGLWRFTIEKAFWESLQQLHSIKNLLNSHHLVSISVH